MYSKDGVIISGDREDKIEVSGKRIVFIPLWKWVLDERQIPKDKQIPKPR
jgi:predicted AAA+ superfamily ATPase